MQLGPYSNLPAPPPPNTNVITLPPGQPVTNEGGPIKNDHLSTSGMIARV